MFWEHYVAVGSIKNVVTVLIKKHVSRRRKKTSQSPPFLVVSFVLTCASVHTHNLSYKSFRTAHCSAPVLTLDLGPVCQCDSRAMALLPYGPDWAGANTRGQVESCGPGRSAGVLPVSSPQSSDSGGWGLTAGPRRRNASASSSAWHWTPKFKSTTVVTLALAAWLYWCRASFVWVFLGHTT